MPDSRRAPESHESALTTFMIRAGAALLIVFAVAWLVWSWQSRASVQREDIDTRIMTGVDACEDGRYDEGFAALEEAATLAHRAGFTDAEAHALLFIGIFRYRRLLEEYAAERSAAFAKGERFALPPERLAECAESVRAALAVDDSLARGHRILGLIHIERGAFPSAVQELRKAIELHTPFPAANTDLAYAWQKLGEMEKARRHHEIAVQHEDAPAETWLNAGLFFANYRESSDEAAANDKKALTYLERYLDGGDGGDARRDLARTTLDAVRDRLRSDGGETE